MEQITSLRNQKYEVKIGSKLYDDKFYMKEIPSIDPKKKIAGAKVIGGIKTSPTNPPASGYNSLNLPDCQMQGNPPKLAVKLATGGHRPFSMREAADLTSYLLSVQFHNAGKSGQIQDAYSRNVLGYAFLDEVISPQGLIHATNSHQIVKRKIDAISRLKLLLKDDSTNDAGVNKFTYNPNRPNRNRGLNCDYFAEFGLLITQSLQLETDIKVDIMATTKGNRPFSDQELGHIALIFHKDQLHHQPPTRSCVVTDNWLQQNVEFNCEVDPERLDLLPNPDSIGQEQQGVWMITGQAYHIHSTKTNKHLTNFANDLQTNNQQISEVLEILQPAPQLFAGRYILPQTNLNFTGKVIQTSESYIDGFKLDPKTSQLLNPQGKPVSGKKVVIWPHGVKLQFEVLDGYLKKGTKLVFANNLDQVVRLVPEVRNRRDKQCCQIY